MDHGGDGYGPSVCRHPHRGRAPAPPRSAPPPWWPGSRRRRAPPRAPPPRPPRRWHACVPPGALALLAPRWGQGAPARRRRRGVGGEGCRTPPAWRADAAAQRPLVDDTAAAASHLDVLKHTAVACRPCSMPRASPRPHRHSLSAHPARWRARRVVEEGVASGRGYRLLLPPSTPPPPRLRAIGGGLRAARLAAATPAAARKTWGEGMGGRWGGVGARRATAPALQCTKKNAGEGGAAAACAAPSKTGRGWGRSTAADNTPASEPKREGRSGGGGVRVAPPAAAGASALQRSGDR